MKMRCLVVLSVVCLSALVAFGQPQKQRGSPTPSPAPFSDLPALAGVKWQRGPSIGVLGNTAQVHVPAGFVFAGGNDTRVIMEAYQNPTSGRELGFIAPEGEEWFAVFEFDDVGYIKDDEKDSLDVDALLESIKAGAAAGNKERQKRGWTLMNIVGWEQQPHYDESTHNLEWAVRAESEGQPIINHNTRLLGRGGVMEVTLVADPSILVDTLPTFKTMLSGFDFAQGQRYAEFRQGDRIAEYGLAGLIVGGTTAVLVKSGAFKWLWKVIVVFGIAIAAFLRKFFARNKTE